MTQNSIRGRPSRISNQSDPTLNKCMKIEDNAEPRYNKKAPTRGGFRAGAGRKKGSTPRYTLEDLVAQVEKHVGMSFAERVAISYREAIDRKDHHGVRDYEKILLAKMVADKTEVTEIHTSDAVEAKSLAFREALEALNTIGRKDRP